MQDNILAVATDERETAWTPGPWHVGADSEEPYSYFVGGGGIVRANMTGPRAERGANAHLIAAAPELFDWLEQADEALDVLDVPADSGLREQIARVLRKARGQS